MKWLYFVFLSSTIYAQSFSISGQIVNQLNKEAIEFADVTIESLHKWQSSDHYGKFSFNNVAAGSYLLAIHRTGFHSYVKEIHLIDSLNLLIELTPSTEEADEILVEGKKNHSELEKPVQQVQGSELRKKLAPTIAETIAGETGISFRSMGSAPARPVLRGLGGDRLLMLEDNGSVGDMSASSSDHAVAIDPLNSNHIDIVRGPESFLFGSNTIGGVVNVARGVIPLELPSNLTGAYAAFGETVNSSYSNSANFSFPLNPFVIRLDASFRKAKNTEAPDLEIENSAIETKTAGLGFSLIKNWGVIGSAFSYYKSDYGIPPDAEGGHASGVLIDMKNTQLRNRAEFTLSSPLQKIVLSHAYTRYQHAEIEGENLGGQEFGTVSQQTRSDFHFAELGKMSKAQMAFEYSSRNYVAAGRSNTPETDSKQFSLISYSEYNFSDAIGFNASLRFDRKTITPSIEEESAAGLQRERSFNGFSGGIAAVYHLDKKQDLEFALVKSFRPPTLEELFSDGPHLAAYNFQIGNTDLDSENGLGLELSYAFTHKSLTLNVSVFQNRFSNFIVAKNTGKKSKKRASLFEYQYTGVDAQMIGFEFTAAADIMENFRLSANLAYMQAEDESTNKPLPNIPPLSARLSLNYQLPQLALSTDLNIAAQQDKLDQFENLSPRRNASGNLIVENGLIQYSQSPTAGYATVDISAEYAFITESNFHLAHILTLSVNNLFNESYSKHLNEIKLVYPEPARNFKLLYKVYF